MSFEIVNSSVGQRWVDALTRAQSRVDVRVELKTPAKKVLSVTSNSFLASVERNEASVVINARVSTRVIFIDENDGYNSEETTTTFTEKLVLKNPEAIATVLPSLHVVETRVVDATQPTFVEATSVVDVHLLGVMQRDVTLVAELKGSVETQKSMVAMPILRESMSNRFEVEDVIELDRDCAGILGVDCSAHLRDIVVSDGKFTLKGTVSANIVATKNVEGQMIYNTYHEFDFAKTITMATIVADDMVSGSVAVTAVTMAASARGGKSELNLDLELLFNGLTVTNQKVETLTDAMSFDHELTMEHGTVNGTIAIEQVNINVDVEGNITMPDGAAFISKVLSTNHARITQVNVVPSDNKITVEGILEAGIVFECEEKALHSQTVQVPFSNTARVDNVTAAHAISAGVSLSFCKIRARRGKELLVDARLGLNLSATTTSAHSAIMSVRQGAVKSTDDSAILIFTATEKETLWDMAKRINISTSEILAQNPGLEQGITAGDKITIYRQKVINF